MASQQRRPKPGQPDRWIVRVYVGTRNGNSVERTRIVHGTARYVKRQAAMFEAEVLAEVAEDAATAGTLNDLLDRWWAHHSTNLEGTTRQGYLSKMKRIRADLGTLPLEDVTPRVLDEFYGALTAEGLTAATVRRHHAIISVAFAQAVKWGDCDRNPAALASPPKVGRREVDVISDELAAELLAAADAFDPEFGMLIRFAAETGARRGELCGLKWKRVDLDAGDVHFARSVVELVGQGLVEKDLKTHASRHCAIDDATIMRLRGHRQAMEDRAVWAGVSLSREAYVFTDNPTGIKPLPPGRVTKAWRKVVDPIANNADNPRPELLAFHPHDLRHYMATSWLLKGVPLAVVSRRLGHENQSTTLGIYSHVTPGADRAAVELVAAARRDALGKVET